MTVSRLTNVHIDHFRSINDAIELRLDAPVVLIHGLNGAGKTSLLCAMELALTAAIPSLQRADATSSAQLLHFGSKRGRIAVEYTTPAGPGSGTVDLGPQSFERSGGLSKPLAQFFSERCFLAQSLLNQLLTIYQQSGSDLESPLSRFVNDLLGLDRLDALERGLKPSLDLRNARKIAPSYIAVERERDRLRDQVARLQKADEAAGEQLTASTSQLSMITTELSSLGVTAATDLEGLQPALAPGAEVADIARYRDAAQRGAAAGRAWDRLAGIRSTSQREVLEQRLRSTEVALEAWRSNAGAAISSLLIRASELGLATSASSGTDVGADLQEQLAQWDRGSRRLREQLGKDEGFVKRVRSIEDEQAALATRGENLDVQLTAASADADGLSKALAAILPHVHEPDCPVCGRDYSDVSDHSLTDDLSARILSLGDLAERLAQVSQDRAATNRRQSELSRELDVLRSSLIPPTERQGLQSRLAKIEALIADGVKLLQPAAAGSRLIEDNTGARRSADLWSSLDSEERALRGDLGQLGVELGFAVDWGGEDFSAVIAEVEHQAASGLERAQRIQDLKLLAAQRSKEVLSSRGVAEASALELATARERLAAVLSAHGSAEALRASARAILQSVAHGRSEVVGRVFNERLNKVWRDLFVRLAPSEAFVPSFFLPTGGDDRGTRPTLRTLHRSGGQGGAPGAMLSAGNLNTAALTLFLALHLSVEPRLPWLLLDDPVQSMDEVHTSQFSALLRTLSKEHGRQVLIAVHDRVLFDYLSLELSPAFNGDELITVEISTSTDGRTRVSPNRRGYKEDFAIVHAA